MGRSSSTGTTLVVLAFLALTAVVVTASDGDPLQDFCVADLTSTLTLNGLVCKNPTAVTANDFVFHGLAKAGNTAISSGSAVTPAFATAFPGLNTLGIAMARLDFAQGGFVTPHTHPRATEMLFVVEGSLYVGFVDTQNKLFATTLHKGDVFVFPRGLVHFELNVGNGPALAIAALNSQNPGVQAIPAALFGSDISDAVLEKAFSVDHKAVQYLKSKFNTTKA